MELTLADKVNIGKALIVLGRNLRDCKDPGVNEETLNAILALGPNLPAIPTPAFVRQPVTDGIMLELLKIIEQGGPVPTSYKNPTVGNALIKLRRNGQIINDGSQRCPLWRLTTDEEKEARAKEIRDRRRHSDIQRAAIKNQGEKNK